MINKGDSKSLVDGSALQRALEEVEQLLGRDCVTRYRDGRSADGMVRRNVSLFRPREVHAVISPNSTSDVQEIVKIFNKHRPGVGLHAISTGRNWGLGSAEPATDDVVTINLQRLNASRQIECGGGWAVIEPGVTQSDLSQALAGTKRIVNVTASSGHTSIIGNALDRGVGLRRQRTEDIVGLEVVLPDGEIARVGWWPNASKDTAVNPYGHGPSLLHLFTQSSLGIVTAAVVRLLPRPEAQRVVRLSFAREKLCESVNTLRRWVEQDLVSGVLKIYDVVSTASYGGAPGSHLVLICVSGTTRRVEAISQVLREEADKSGLFSEITYSDQNPAAANDFVLQVVEHAYAGSPVHNELMLRAATGVDANDVDSKGGGWIFFLAFVPFNGEAIAHALNLIDSVHSETGVQAGTTVNALSSDVIDLVVSLKFPANTEASKHSQHALDRIYDLFCEKGFYPYRLDIEHAHWREKLAADASAVQLNRRIKKLLDPNSVMAPGRYA